MKKYRAYVYGMISFSHLNILDKRFSFPSPNSYAEVFETYYIPAGEALNAAIILSKFGVKTKLDGNWLGHSYSAQIIKVLKNFGVDISLLKIKKDYKGAVEDAFSDGKTRTIFGNYCQVLFGEKRQWNKVSTSEIKKSDIVSIDPFFIKESERAARICLKYKKPYVTIDCLPDSFICKNASSVIVSEDYLLNNLKIKNFKKIFNSYLNNCNGLVIMTFGSKKLYYARKGQKIKTFLPYKINPVDTLAAGDCFRGAVVYGLLKKWNDEKIVRFSSAVGALICLTKPGAMHPPSLHKIMKFMKTRTS